MAKIVLVEWADARFIEGWYERTSDFGIIECVTAGILLKENGKEIIVSCHRNEEHIAGAMAIPRACIKRMRTLKVVKSQ